MILFYELYNYFDVLLCRTLKKKIYLQLLVLPSVFCICFISGTLCKQVCKAFKMTLFENKVYKQTNKQTNKQ